MIIMRMNKHGKKHNHEASLVEEYKTHRHSEWEEDKRVQQTENFLNLRIACEGKRMVTSKYKDL